MQYFKLLLFKFFNQQNFRCEQQPWQKTTEKRWRRGIWLPEIKERPQSKNLQTYQQEI